MTEPFTVMAKPVGPQCNLACNYCYYLNTGQPDDAAHVFRMSDAMLETYIRAYIEASPGPVISFVWHGGEPTLAGLDFFRQAVELQKRYLPDGWTCWNNLQTNGLLLDDTWCSFLAEAHFDVGLSIDGTETLHDEYRKDLGGHGTYGRAAAGIRRLQAHGIQPDLLCTVTASIAKEPLAVYQALKGFNTGWIQFIPIVRLAADGSLTPDSVTSEGLGQFLSTIFDEWSAHDLGRLDVQQFAEMSLVWSGGKTNLCWMAPTCGRVLVLEHDGRVFACDHFVNSAHRIGEIAVSPLDALADAPSQRQFGNDKRDRLTRQCRSCTWLEICHGGCPKDRIALSEDGEPGHLVLCDGFRRFFSHAEQPLRRILQLRKQGISNEAIMADLRSTALAQWKGIGRNDPCPCGSGRKAKQCCWSRRS